MHRGNLSDPLHRFVSTLVSTGYMIGISDWNIPSLRKHQVVPLKFCDISCHAIKRVFQLLESPIQIYYCHKTHIPPRFQMVSDFFHAEHDSIIRHIVHFKEAKCYDRKTYFLRWQHLPKTVMGNETSYCNSPPEVLSPMPRPHGRRRCWFGAIIENGFIAEWERIDSLIILHIFNL